jgi:hypothetical protein
MPSSESARPPGSGTGQAAPPRRRRHGSDRAGPGRCRRRPRDRTGRAVPARRRQSGRPRCPRRARCHRAAAWPCRAPYPGLGYNSSVRTRSRSAGSPPNRPSINHRCQRSAAWAIPVILPRSPASALVKRHFGPAAAQRTAADGTLPCHHSRRTRLPHSVVGVTRMKCAGTPSIHGSSPAPLIAARSASVSR